MAAAYTGSLYYGPTPDATRFYTVSSFGIPGSDFSFAFVVRLHHLSDLTADVSSGEFPLFRNTAYTNGTGGNDKYARVYPDNQNSSGAQKQLAFGWHSGGTDILGGELLGTTVLQRNKPLLLVMQRTGSTMELRACYKGDSSSTLLASGSVLTAALTSNTLDIGIGWANYVQAFFAASQAYSDANIVAMAGGANPESVVTVSGNRLAFYDFASGGATIADGWGAGTATRNGTWTATQVAGPFLPMTGAAAITCAEPIPHHPIALAYGLQARTHTFTGTYANFTPTTFQGRILNAATAAIVVDWTDLGSFTASAGNWSGTMSVPAGGQYVLRIRDKTDTAKSWAGSNPWECCPVAVTTGQSPMVKLNSDSLGTTTLNAKLIQNYVSSPDNELAAQTTAGTGRGVAEAANTWHTASGGIPLAVIAAAAVGTSSTQWANNAGAQWLAMLAKLDAAGGLSEVLEYWLNGAADVGLSDATIKANHDTIYTHFGADVTTTRGIAFRRVIIPHNRDTSGPTNFDPRVSQKQWAENHAQFGASVFLGPMWTDMETDAENISGTAQAGGASTITLAAGTPTSSQTVFQGGTVTITGGTGSGQVRTADTINTATKVLNVTTAWGTNPDATSTYTVVGTSPHPSTRGCQMFGPRWGLDLASRYGYATNTGKGPTIAGATYPASGTGSDGSIIDVTATHRHGANLRTPNGGTTATGVFGFDVSEDNFSTLKTISAAAITAANKVRLTLSAAPTDKTALKVRYLYGEPVSAVNWARVADTVYDDTGATTGTTGGLQLEFTETSVSVTQAVTGGPWPSFVDNEMAGGLVALGV